MSRAGRGHRWSRASAAILFAALMTGCVDSTGPTAVADGSLAFTLYEPQAISQAESDAIAAAFGAVDFYTVRIVDASTAEEIVSATVTVQPALDAHVLDIDIPEDAFGRTVTISLVAYASATELYRSATTTTLQEDVGRITVDLEIRYSGPGIRGTVVDDAGDPAADVTVQLFRQEALVTETVTDEDGTYLFVDDGFGGSVDLAAGTYLVGPAAAPGVVICPGLREVQIVDGDESILADFRSQSDLCLTSVLVVSGGDFDDTGVVANLLQADRNLEVSTFFFVNQLPGVDLLRQYDVLLVFMNGLFDESGAVGDQIAEYVGLGGNVVVSSFYFQGRSDSGLGSVGWGGLEAVDPFTALDGGATYQPVALDPTSLVVHPLTSGLSVLASLSYSSGVAAKASTQVVARWDDGAPLVGYRTGTAGQRIVGVSLFPAATSSVEGDVETLWLNAVRWAGEAGGPN